MSREWRYVNSRFICKDGNRYYGIYTNAVPVEGEESHGIALELLKAGDNAHVTQLEGVQRILKKLWHRGEKRDDVYRKPEKLSREVNSFLDAYVVRKLL